MSSMGGREYFARQGAVRSVTDHDKTAAFMRQAAARSMMPDPGYTLDESYVLQAQQVGSDHYEFADLYQVGEKLSAGSFGTVFQCFHKADPTNLYAVKILDRARLKQKDSASVFREMAILQELRSLDHVVSLIDFFQDDAQLYIVQVLAAGGDVFDRLSHRQHYTEKDARDLALVLLKTVAAIHKVPIIHRDLKPENLLLRYPTDDTSILLADFGFARHVRPGEWCQTRCGTPAFVAPEILLGIPYGCSADLWSIGCLLYMLIGGYPPFRGENHRELFCRVRAGDFVFHDTVFGGVSVSAKTLISNLLTVNVDSRYTAQQALQSDWFQRESPEKLEKNDLSSRTISGFKQFIAQRRWRAAKAAITWAATAPFWKPDQVTFSQQVATWDKQAINKQMAAEQPLATGETSEQQQQQDQSSMPPPQRQLSRIASARVPTSPMPNITVPLVRFKEVYRLKRQLRSGSSATVWECVHINSSEIYACKVIDRRGLKPADDEAVLSEVAAMQSLSGSKFTVQLLDFYEEPESFFLVMEYMAGGDVFDRIVNLTTYTEKDARDLAKTLLKAVLAMHQAGIAHRDLKPQNLLLRSQDDHASVKVGDFGFSRRVHTPNSLTSRVGTPTYVAPEILKNIPHDERVDLWAVGVIVFVLLVGYPPFLEDDQALLFDNIRMGNWSFVEEDWQHISNDAKDMIRGLLVVDPKERWTEEEALRCRWINQDAFSLSSISLQESMSSIRMRRNRLRRMATTVMWCNDSDDTGPTEDIPTQAQHSMDIVQEGDDEEDLSISLSASALTIDDMDDL